MIVQISSYVPLSDEELLEIYNSSNLPVCMNVPVPNSMDGTTFMEIAFNTLLHNSNVEGYKRLATIGDIAKLIPSVEKLNYDSTTTVLLEYAYSVNFAKKWTLWVYLPLSNGPLKFTLDPEGNILYGLPN